MDNLQKTGLELQLNHYYILKELDLINKSSEDSSYKEGFKAGYFVANRKFYVNLLVKELMDPKNLIAEEKKFLNSMKEDEKKLFGKRLDVKQIIEYLQKKV